MPLLPGAEPYRHHGGPVGVLVCHGFTGSPASMRPWAERAAAEGFSVSLPLLPGHGTHWRDLNTTRWQDWYATVERGYLELADECEQVFVFGLSMGGLLARMPGQTHVALPVVRHLVPSLPGITSDIAKPGVDEGGYTRTPLHAAWSMKQLTKIVQAELPTVTQPLLLFRSPQDNVVPPASGKLLLERVGSKDLEERLLERSYHVATLDYDAETIFDGSIDFVRRLTVPVTKG
jgi:carboxylesterase